MNNASENSFTIEPAQRIASFKPYFFASLISTIQQLREQNMDVIRLDMGSPDLPPADFIIESLIETAKRPDIHGYTPHGGTPGYRKATSQYYKDRFDVTLDPDTEVLGLLGAKEGLFNFSQVINNPGDLNLVPDPAYPVYKASSTIAGARIYSFPLLEDNGFLPDLSAIPEKIAWRAKVLWLNYPNNPTGAIATLDFLKEVVAFARKYEIIIAYDAPYTEICFGDYQAPSIMQVDGAKDLAVEFNSLSKTYNMAGWRLGAAVGNSQIIKVLKTYKSQMDSSHFSGILNAGITALTGDQTWLTDRNNIYQERRDIVVQALRKLGFRTNLPNATIYVWAHIPDGYTSDMEFTNRLLHETGVSITPGSIYGEYGKNYLRISLGNATEKIKEAMDRVTNWIGK